MTIHNLIYSQRKQIANRDLRRRKTAALSDEHGRSIVSGKNVLSRLDLKESREGFCRREKGKVNHVEGPKTEEALKPTVEIKSGTKTLEAESIRSRAVSTGVSVKLKTATL